MTRFKTFQVKDNRVRFICSHCQAKRSLAVSPQARSKSVQCHRCGERSRFNLNRRSLPREQQSGKVVISLSSGRELEIDLHDISAGGVGADLKPGGSRLISLTEEVQFKCGWNPNLFAGGRYIVKSISGNRIGIQNIAFRS